MFDNYLATPDDLRTIGEALGFVMHPIMRFVFGDLSTVKKTLVVSYDSKLIYIWRLDSKKPEYKIPHRIKIKDEWQSGWSAGVEMDQVESFLPVQIKNKSRFEIPIISGGFMTPFIALQKAKKIQYNPYVARESYLATIIHEFGHVHWNSYKLWWYSSKKENIRYLHLTSSLYASKEKQNSLKELTFRLTSPAYLGEVFAFCAEYYASEHFWKNHKRNLDAFTEKRLNTLINLEREKNLDREDSVIEPNHLPHDFASILGKIIFTKHPRNWPEILTKPSFIL